MNAMVRKALTNPETRATLVERGIIPTPSSPEELTAFVDGEIRRWSEVVAAAKIAIE